MMVTIFTGIAFACGFALILFLNMGLDDTILLRMSGYEISDLLVYTAPHTSQGELREEISQMEGVRKTSIFENSSATIHGDLLTTCLSDDFSQLETLKPYEGTFPVYDNEIALTGVLAEMWGKSIGDTIEVSYNGVSAEYIICGLGQTMSNFGRQCFLSVEGEKRIHPTYEPQSVQVYLEPGIDQKEYIRILEQQFKTISPSEDDEADQWSAARKTAEEKMMNLLSMYGVDSVQYALMADGEIILSGDTAEYRIDRIENNRELFVSNVNSIKPAVVLVSIVIMLGTLLIISLVFYMVIKSMIVRRQYEFGIYKALGYTDRQLIQQIVISFLPVSVLGTTIGCLLLGLTVNGIASALFSRIGISSINFSVNLWVMMAAGILIVVYSVGISIVIAGKIRSISAYRLLTER